MIYTKKYTFNRDAELVQLFRQSFSNSEGEDEGKVIASLVNEMLTNTPAHDLHVFVAEEQDKLIAGVIFSRFTVQDNEVLAFILSPMAVATEYQGRGVGQQLIQYGHEQLKKQHVQFVITYGDINFYSKVGYKPINEEIVPAPVKLSFPEGWIAQSFEMNELKPIAGPTFCVPALMNPIYW